MQEPSPLASFVDVLRLVKYKRSEQGRKKKDNLLRQIDNDFAVIIKLEEGDLQPGDEIKVVLGAKEGFPAPKRETAYQILVRLDGDGDGKFGLVPAPHRVGFDVYSASTHSVKLIGPANLYPGETGRMVLRFQDGYFLPNLTRFKQARVQLEPLDGLTFPRQLELSGSLENWDQSLAEVSVKALKAGVYRIRGTALVDGKEFKIRSNPLEVISRGKQKIYFGDTHLHSILSYDADRPPEYVYRRMINQERLDFATLSDHDMIGAVPFAPRDGVRGRTPGEWAYMKGLADKFNKPGEFITFKAYEWTSYFYGHRNIYFAPHVKNPPLLHHNHHTHSHSHSHGDDHTNPKNENTPDELRQALGANQELDYIAIPHSTAWPTSGKFYRWGPGKSKFGKSFGNPELWPEQRLLELYSTHGTSEYHNNEYPVDKGRPEAPTDSFIVKKIMNYDIQQADKNSGNFARDALAAGWRLGFIGSSDMHFLSHIDQAYKYGLAAVFAGELTRKGIWLGWKNRRTFAVTGVRMLLHFSCNEVPMGGNVVLKKNTPLNIKGRVLGTNELERIEVVKFDGKSYTILFEKNTSAVMDFEFSLKDSAAKVGVFYFLRVRQKDGNRAWSTPIWVTDS